MIAAVDPVLDERGDLREIVQVISDITDRKRAEEAMRAALVTVEDEKAKTAGVIAAMGDGISIQDRNFRILYQNEVQRELIGDHTGEFCYEAYERREKVCEECPVAAALADGQVHRAERVYVTDDGPVTVEITASPLRDATGNIVGGIEIVRDITARKQDEANLKRLNRSLKMISACNHALVQAETEKGLLHEICRIIVEVGEHRMAWVGFAEHDEEKSIVPAAWCGFEDGYLEAVKITWSDTETGQGPAGTAVRSGIPQIVEDINSDPRFMPWHKEAVARGYISLVSLPLKTDGNAIGALSIYSGETGAFSESERELLQELADDISYGIKSLRSEAQRKRIEKELHEREEMYRLLFDQSPVGIFHYDNQLRITDCNDFFVAILKSGRESLIGLDMNTLHDQSMLRAIKQAVQGESGNYEGFYRSTTGDGEVFVILRTVPLVDIAGNIKGGIGIVEDITERVKADNELRTSEEKFAKAFRNVPVWVVIASIEDGRYFEVNETFLRQTGYSREEVIGKTALELGIWAEPDERRKIIERIRSVGAVSNVEVKRRTKSGEVLIMLFSAEIINIAGQECLLSVSHDISDRKHAEELLFQSKHDWEDSFDSITDMVTVHDKDYNIIRANKAAEKILGLPFLQLSEAKCFAYYHGTEKPPKGCPSCDCLVTGKPALFEIFEPHLNMFIEIRANPRFDSTGQLVGLIHVVRDITERKKAEERIREYTEGLEQKVRERTKEYEDAKLMAESSSRAKSVFLSNMSHELRTPLNTIIGFSEALISGIYGDLGSRHKEYINDILQSGMHLLTLVNGILDLSKIEAGRMELEYSDFSVKEIIGGAVYMFREKARKHMIDLRTDIHEHTGTFTVDGVKIKQVLINLLANALKFTPDGGSVIVRARQADFSGDDEQSEPPASVRSRGPRGDWIEISVEDTGIGISEEDQERLFSPFEQVHSLLEKKREGTGLGLALCKRFVELHGGSIRVESPSLLRLEPAETLKSEEEHYKGSRFIITLPRKPIDDTLKHKKE